MMMTDSVFKKKKKQLQFLSYFEQIGPWKNIIHPSQIKVIIGLFNTINNTLSAHDM